MVLLPYHFILEIGMKNKLILVIMFQTHFTSGSPMAGHASGKISELAERSLYRRCQ